MKNIRFGHWFRFIYLYVLGNSSWDWAEGGGPKKAGEEKFTVAWMPRVLQFSLVLHS